MENKNEMPQQGNDNEFAAPYSAQQAPTDCNSAAQDYYNSGSQCDNTFKQHAPIDGNDKILEKILKNKTYWSETKVWWVSFAVYSGLALILGILNYLFMYCVAQQYMPYQALVVSMLATAVLYVLIGLKDLFISVIKFIKKIFDYISLFLAFLHWAAYLFGVAFGLAAIVMFVAMALMIPYIVVPLWLIGTGGLAFLKKRNNL